MTARDHREQRRESRAGATSLAQSPAPARISVTRGVGWQVIFSTPSNHHDVVNAARHPHIRLEKCRAARSARRFEAGGGNAAHSEGGRDVWREVILCSELQARRNCPDRKLRPGPGSSLAFASAFSPAATASARKSRSGNAPKGVLPAPMMETCLTRPHLYLRIARKIVFHVRAGWTSSLQGCRLLRYRLE